MFCRDSYPISMMYFQRFQYFPSEDDAWERSLWRVDWEMFSVIIFSEKEQHNFSNLQSSLASFEFNISLFEICLIEKVFQHLRSLLKFLNSPKSNQLLKLLKEIGTFEFYLIKSLNQICPEFERLSTATDGNVRWHLELFHRDNLGLAKREIAGVD